MSNVTRSRKLILDDLRILLRQDGIFTHTEPVTMENFIEVAESMGAVQVETKASRYLLVPVPKEDS